MEVYVKIWRYSINDGKFGGIVYADNIELAKEKVKHKYTEYDNHEILVWRMLNDDYFDTDNPDVWECYGI